MPETAQQGDSVRDILRKICNNQSEGGGGGVGDDVDASEFEFSATNRILGRITSGAGAGEELTGSQVRTILGLATGDSPTFVGLTLSGAIAGANSVTSVAGQPLVLAVGTGGTVATFANSTGALTLGQGALNFTGAAAITGGAGNMTIVSGTGNSRTMIFQTTTSGGTPTTALTIGADQRLYPAGHILGFGVASTAASGAGSALNGQSVVVTDTGTFQFSSGSLYNSGSDGFISRKAAATIHLGTFDAASPIAQTLGAQGSRSGTDSNVAGANFTVRSGIGTGNSTGSSLIFQTPNTTSSGTGAQTSTTRLTLLEAGATFEKTITTGAPNGGTAAPFKIGVVASVTPTLQNRTIEIDISGTRYFLTAKTTND